MVPPSLPTTIPRGNTSVSQILVAVDDSEHFERALRYVGTLLRDTRDVHVAGRTTVSIIAEEQNEKMA